MLKVLIVEDEELIRKGIVLTVDWAAMDCVVVGEITQIYDKILYVVHSGSTVGKQCSYILKQSAGLLLYVAKIHHLSPIVDTCRSGYVICLG